MKVCERCGCMVLAFGDWTTLPICVCPPEPNPTPQKQPFRCPVCGGSGMVDERLYDLYPLGATVNNTHKINCRSCNGTGIVWGGEK